jgi:FkbH-like protein
MRLAEALSIVRTAKSSAQSYRAFLACGFEPLHLRTFLQAHLHCLKSNRNVEVLQGRYGDLLGNVQLANREDVDSIVVVLEWTDLDARLGVRQLGAWTPAAEDDIATEARKRLDALASVLLRVAAERPLVCSLPTLPLLPFAHTASWQASPAEICLHEAVHAFASGLRKRARVLNVQALDYESPLPSRHDVKSELTCGFPYQLAHTDRLAELLAKLIAPPQPKKALITDLDNCLWAGIVGEVGVDGVHWDLDRGSQLHGLYQQLLHSLAVAGALVGAASRNDREVVEMALRRSDLLLEREQLFPVEAHWGPKSESVARIVRQWNIADDAVVFVDDSPMELAEVKAVHPLVECLLFPVADINAAHSLLVRLRALFGKEHILEEDLIRAESLRRARPPAAAASDSHAVNARFLEDSGAELSFSRLKPPPDPRALELVNKTNQFNLNGRRYDEVDWNRRLSDRGSVHLMVAYRDKFGPLGKVAVLSGRLQARILFVDTWVMSCRAFGRQIEHGALKHLFDRYPVGAIGFDYVRTHRNGPVGNLLRFYLDDLPDGTVALSRELFLSKCPALFHEAKAEAEGVSDE